MPKILWFQPFKCKNVFLLFYACKQFFFGFCIVGHTKQNTRLINESRDLTADLSMRLNSSHTLKYSHWNLSVSSSVSLLSVSTTSNHVSLSSQAAEEAERGQSHQAARGSLWCPGEAGWRVSHAVSVLVKTTGDTEDQHSHTLINVNACVSTFLSVFKWSAFISSFSPPHFLCDPFSRFLPRFFSLFVQLHLSGAININIASSYPVSQRTSCSERLIDAVAVCVWYTCRIEQLALLNNLPVNITQTLCVVSFCIIKQASATLVLMWLIITPVMFKVDYWIIFSLSVLFVRWEQTKDVWNKRIISFRKEHLKWQMLTADRRHFLMIIKQSVTQQEAERYRTKPK